MKNKNYDEKKMIDKLEEKKDEITDEKLESRPGKENKMETKPVYDDDFLGANRLKDKVAIITGGDSGIGRAVAIAYAKEGAKLSIVYKEEVEDAEKTKSLIESLGAEVITILGDVGDPEFCSEVVDKTIEKFGEIHILVNNAGEQHPVGDIEKISTEQLERTFKTNIFSMFYMVQAALPHLKENSSIINTGSVTAYEGSGGLLDYSATKGAIATFTRSLAQNLAERKIRVNQVAPGPIWTPLIPSTFDGDKVKNFGENTLFERPGQPIELVEAYIFFGWLRASSFITGQTIHINGGQFMTD